MQDSRPVFIKPLPGLVLTQALSDSLAYSANTHQGAAVLQALFRPGRQRWGSRVPALTELPRTWDSAAKTGQILGKRGPVGHATWGTSHQRAHK